MYFALAVYSVWSNFGQMSDKVVKVNVMSSKKPMVAKKVAEAPKSGDTEANKMEVTSIHSLHEELSKT